MFVFIAPVFVPHKGKLQQQIIVNLMPISTVYIRYYYFYLVTHIECKSLFFNFFNFLFT